MVTRPIGDAQEKSPNPDMSGGEDYPATSAKEWLKP